MSQKRKRNKKWIYWLLMAILLVIAGVIGFFVWNSYFNNKKDDNKEITSRISEKEEVNTEEKISQDEVDKRNTDEEDAGRKVKQYEGEDPNKAAELSGSVTYAGVVDGKLMIRVNIDQYLTSGSCELILSRNEGVVYNRTTAIVGNASTATCEGFDVPMSEIGGGNYNIVINISSGEKVGSIRGEVEI